MRDERNVLEITSINCSGVVYSVASLGLALLCMVNSWCHPYKPVSIPTTAGNVSGALQGGAQDYLTDRCNFIESEIEAKPVMKTVMDSALGIPEEQGARGFFQQQLRSALFWEG